MSSRMQAMARPVVRGEESCVGVGALCREQKIRRKETWNQRANQLMERTESII